MVTVMNNVFGSYFNYWSVYVIAIVFINFMIVLPIVFKFFIIPKIEKRIGEKLQYKNPIYRWQIFSSWFMPPVDIAPTIISHYLIWKIKKRPPGKIFGFNPKSYSALVRIPYDVRQATWLEIAMSFLVIVNISLFVFLGLVAWLFPKWI